METLPKEILIEIFDKFKSKDLLTLTIVCKSFNEIISNNKRLMNQLVLRFNDNSSKQKLKATRKYTRIHMLHNYCGNLLEFAEKFGSNIWDVRLVYVRMELSMLKSFLNSCPNLKRLVFVHLNVVFTNSDLCEPLPRLNLTTLSTNGDRRLFRLLMECSVKELTVYRVYNDHQELKVFQQFLKRQKKLQKLDFTNFREDYRLFESSKLTEVDFQLTELRLHNFVPFDTRNFEKFLENHKESLKSVTLKEYKLPLRSHIGILRDILELFRKMKSVRNLKLKGFDVNRVKTFHFIETLELEDYFKIERNLAEKFPNLRHLLLSHCKNVQNVEFFGSLESLSISHYRFESSCLRLPNVKSLTFNSVTFDNNLEKPFDSKDLKIEKLTILSCNELTWIKNFITSTQNNLKYLKIEDSKLNKNLQKFLENESKISYLKIVKKSKNDDDDEWNLKDIETDSEYFGEEEENDDEEDEDEDDDDLSDDDETEASENEVEMLLNDIRENNEDNYESKRMRME